MKILFCDRGCNTLHSSSNYWLNAFNRVGSCTRIEYVMGSKFIQQVKQHIKTSKPSHMHFGSSVISFGRSGHGTKRIRNLVDLAKRYNPNVKATGYYGDPWLKGYPSGLENVLDLLLVSNKSFGGTYTIPPYEPTIFHPITEEKKYDILFVGNPRYERAEILRYLQGKFNVEVRGVGWEKHNIKSGGPISLIDQNRLIAQSKIVLDIVNQEFQKLVCYMSNRPSNVLGAKGFLVHTYVMGLEEVYQNGTHLVWYNTLSELEKIIEYFLNKDTIRDKIAEEGYKRVTSTATYDQIVQRLLYYKNVK